VSGHIGLNEISNLIRRKCGFETLTEEGNAQFFNKDEQQVILTKLMLYEETLKALDINEDLSNRIAEKVVKQLNEKA
jgi:hypothetical protein